LKAAKVGDIALLRELLAAGVPVDSRDQEEKTALLCAAQFGQFETFRVLAEAGADLHAVALDQLDALECAAEGGNAEIVRFLLEMGLPIEGHWQPRSQAARKQGHLTPLLIAALYGHTEVIRLFLHAGADRNARFDRQTALQLARGQAQMEKQNGNLQQQQRYLEAVALLREEPS
jgi:ankyrin repeat protein